MEKNGKKGLTRREFMKKSAAGLAGVGLASLSMESLFQWNPAIAANVSPPNLKLEKDPVVKTYQKIYPALFKPLAEMPEDLKEHLRYPEDLFMVQAHKYAVFHMEDPQVFYNQEDLWNFPT